MIRRILSAVGAGLLTAALMALVMTPYFRALMALLAENFGDLGSFTLAGTAGIAAIVFLFGIPGAIVLATHIRRRWIGYAVVLLGTLPHWSMLAGGLTDLPPDLDTDHIAGLAVAYVAYAIAIAAYTAVTGRLASALRRRFDPSPATASALP